MNRAEHEYPAEQWIDFVEGLLQEDRSVAMRAHIAACPVCRRTLEDLLISRTQLEQLKHRFAASGAAADPADASVRRAVLARIRMTQAASSGQAIAIGVRELRSILQPFCGSATADSAIRTAAHQCKAAGTDELENHHWEPFVVQLRAIVDTICGSSVAQWITETARGIQWEAGR